MPIAELLAARAAIREQEERYRRAPAFLLVATPLTSPRDQVASIALFDTREAAVAYEAAARRGLPAQGQYVDGYFRFYRRDSLLWDSVVGIETPTAETEEERIALMVQEAPTHLPDLEALPMNPSLAAGDTPPADEVALAAGQALLTGCDEGEPGSVLSLEHLAALLMMVSHDVPVEVLDRRSGLELRAAQVWAAAMHAEASDNVVDRPPKPRWLNPFSRVSPGLPLGWQHGQPTPPESLDACEDEALLIACMRASLTRALQAETDAAGVQVAAQLDDAARRFVSELDHLHVLLHATGRDLTRPDFVEFSLRMLFAANRPPPAIVHLDDADRIWRRLQALWNGAALTPPSVTELRLRTAAELRRALAEHLQPATGIWAGCSSVFPRPRDAWARELLELHQQVVEGSLSTDTAHLLIARVDGLTAVSSPRLEVVKHLRRAQSSLRRFAEAGEPTAS